MCVGVSSGTPQRSKPPRPLWGASHDRQKGCTPQYTRPRGARLNACELFPEPDFGQDLLAAHGHPPATCSGEAYGGDDVIVASANVTASQGGRGRRGPIGNSVLDVPGEAVDDPATVQLVKMRVNRIGGVSAELRPNGLRFRRAVMLTLSYKGADLGGIDERKLRIYCYNDATGAWELVPGSVPYLDEDVVRAALWHFSRYAIGNEG